MSDNAQTERALPAETGDLPTVTDASRGVNLDAQRDVNNGGDVTGRDKVTEIDRLVDTGGGTYVDGNVTIEGQSKFIGRDDNSISVSDSPGAIVAHEVTVIQPVALARVDKRFWVALAIITSVIVIGLGVAIAALTQIPPMPDGFNIAVAQFVERDANGTLAVTKDSQALSDWLVAAIQKESAQLPASLRLGIRGPDQIGSIPGTDDQQRAANACRVAERHNATILIYGVITADAGSYHVRPEFCVNDKSFDYGSEVVGPDHLGQPVPYQPPLSEPGTLTGVNEKLDARTSALQHLVKGLAYYYVSQSDSALSEFRRAAETPDWPPELGKEVVYMLIGAAQMLGYDPKAPIEQRDEILRNASTSFAKARQLNPDYARSYLGLGSVALQQATIDPKRIDVEKLGEASGWYFRSLTSADQPVSAHVPLKAALGLGQIHLAGYKNQLPGWSADQARSYFEEVIAGYEADPSPDLAWLAGHAHCELGYLAGLEKSDWSTMSAQCRKAIEILEALPGTQPRNWIARYWSWVGQAEDNNQHIEAAQNAYREAIKIGSSQSGSDQSAVSAEELAGWQAALDRLGK